MARETDLNVNFSANKMVQYCHSFDASAIDNHFAHVFAECIRIIQLSDSAN